MYSDEAARSAAEINFEIVVVHGLEARVGFEWQETFIHNPFVDPQYGAFDVDPVQQYGDDYLNSIFVTDPGKALESAQRQLRELAAEDIARYGEDHRLGVPDLVANIEAACGVRVPEADDLLEALSDEQVAKVWMYVENLTRSGRIS
jgi:hypothetical protein